MDNERGCGLDCGEMRGAWWKPRGAAVSTRGQDICWHGLLGRSQSRSREETEASRLLSGAPLLLLFVSDFISNIFPAWDKMPDTSIYTSRAISNIWRGLEVGRNAKCYAKIPKWAFYFSVAWLHLNQFQGLAVLLEKKERRPECWNLSSTEQYH